MWLLPPITTVVIDVNNHTIKVVVYVIILTLSVSVVTQITTLRLLGGALWITVVGVNYGSYL